MHTSPSEEMLLHQLSMTDIWAVKNLQTLDHENESWSAQDLWRWEELFLFSCCTASQLLQPLSIAVQQMTENNWWSWRSLSTEKTLLFWCLHCVMQLLTFLIKDLVKEECRKSLAGLPRKIWMDIRKRMLCLWLNKYLRFYFVNKPKFLTEEGLKVGF